ncbi:MAG: hypothetical protein J07HQW2_02913 [Haloquadratum walsbyi J07HQW2]|uniref:Uncharacterized protein n=1 Tax=Haloquadratum walsbyi J07HQW2 TaxID=1238425 RepID=U1N0T9_9EURY|nr:MAG: hypothetical protein J07HQW2_02913 [Haloquadratum walsbyi J07HQW2]
MNDEVPVGGLCLGGDVGVTCLFRRIDVPIVFFVVGIDVQVFDCVVWVFLRGAVDVSP